MRKVRVTITGGVCRAGLCKPGDSYIVTDVCPPLCHELWHCAYPMVYALLCGGALDAGEGKARAFTIQCPDGGRVTLRGESIQEDESEPPRQYP